MKKIKKEYKILPRTLDQSFDMLISMEVTDHIESGNTDKRFWNPILVLTGRRVLATVQKKTSMNFYKLLSKKIYAF
jgi:hypothetical protein